MVSNRGSSAAVVRPVLGSVVSCRARAQRGAVRVACHERLEDLREPQTGLACRGLQGQVRFRVAKLLVIGGQAANPFGQSILLRAVTHVSLPFGNTRCSDKPVPGRESSIRLV